MSLTTLIIQIALTIPLTLILNYCKKTENNKLEQIIIPSAYIIIMSALLPSVKENIFLIVIFEIFIRNFYITNITSNNGTDSTKSFIISGLLSIGLSLFTYNYFIANVESVIPNPEDIKSFIWFLIIIFVANIYKRSSTEKEIKETKKSLIRKKEHIIMQYAKYKSKYNNIIKSKNKIVNELVYAIMVHESIKTPSFYRKIEEYVGAITKKETKYGIMRIPSYSHLTDEQSINITIESFENQIKEMTSGKNVLDELLINYTLQDKDNIIYIYNEINEFSKK